jgi:adenine deaminase
LHAYLSAGVNSDHESRSEEEILEKLRAGMLIYIRESSVSQFADIAAKAWKSVPYASNIAMSTDDIEPNDMLKNGQMNRVVRRAIEEGIPAPLAIRYATLGGAIRYGLRDRGAIAAGYVFVQGTQMVADGGGLCLVENVNIVAQVDLPIAGLMAPETIEELSPKVEKFNEKARSMGVKVGRRSPSMALSSLTLTVIPEIRISDLGLVDVNEQKLIPLFVK